MDKSQDVGSAPRVQSNDGHMASTQKLKYKVKHQHALSHQKDGAGVRSGAGPIPDTLQIRSANQPESKSVDKQSQQLIWSMMINKQQASKFALESSHSKRAEGSVDSGTPAHDTRLKAYKAGGEQSEAGRTPSNR